MSVLLQQYGGLLQAALLAAAFFVLSIALTCAAAYPLLRRRFAALPPNWRANLLFGWAALPLAGTMALLLLSFAPSLLTWAGLAPDHCHLHPDHPHLCLLHPPHIEGGMLLVTGALAGIAAMVTYLAGWVLDCWRTRRMVANLMRLSRRDEAHGMHVVAVDAPLAFAAGLRTPELFVSRHLLAQLTPAQLAIVIAHERAHAARQDTLRHMIAALVSRLHAPTLRRCLLADLSLAAEQACDERAAAEAGGRLAVADAILSVEKLFARWMAAGTTPRELQAVSHFIGSNVTDRVQALLDAPRTSHPSCRALLLAPACALAGLVILAEPLHHMTESLLGFIFH